MPCVQGRGACRLQTERVTVTDFALAEWAHKMAVASRSIQVLLVLLSKIGLWLLEASDPTLLMSVDTLSWLLGVYVCMDMCSW